MTALDSLALYIHWPWCQSKCPYCDFNSHATAPDETGWRDAILREMETEAHALGLEGRAVSSIFFGGGTPGLMSPASAGAVIERAAKLFAPTRDIEITLEANPSSVEVEKFRGFKGAGINRVSIGVQSFDDDALKFLGRAHDANAARRAIGAAGEIFDRFSFDLIYARPGQTPDAWAAELDEALSFSPRHLSLYQLTIERGTQFAKDRVPGADEMTGADFYEATQVRMNAVGLPAYEVSNHAQPGEEARHNVHIWRGGEYLGLGPGAHGRICVQGGTNVCQEPGHWEAHRRAPDPARWMKLVHEKGQGAATVEVVEAQDRAEEIILGALRLTDGLATATVAALAGVAFEDVIDGDALHWLVNDGFLVRTKTHVHATAKGRLALNAVIAKLLA